MNWTKGLLWALLLTVVLVVLWAMLESSCTVDWIAGVPEAGCEEKFYSKTTGPLPQQRPAVALPGPSPNNGPLVNPRELAVAQGNASPVPGLSVTQHYGPGLFAPDVQIDSRCRAACDADPACAAYAVFDTAVDPMRGLSGRGCRTYTNPIYAPSVDPTLIATASVSPSQLERDGYPAAVGPATIYTKV